MLAQSFKTAEELGLDDAEHGALVKVLGMLEREEIPGELFDMARIGRPQCGTPGCILGWARTVDESVFKTYPWKSVRALFMRPFDLQRGSGSPLYAATALRNFLTTGEPNWAEAMS